MASVYKKSRPDPADPAKRLKARKYTCLYFDPRVGRQREAPGFTDKAASQARADRLEKNASRRAEGLAVSDVGPRPIATWRDEWLAALLAAGASEHHHRTAQVKLGKLINALDWDWPVHLQGEALSEWLTRSKRAANTRNGYLRYAKLFGRFLVERGALAANPFAGLRAARVRRDQRPHRRRALSDAELHALVRTAPSDRSAAYALAAFTGFRRNTLERLERRHLDDRDPARPVWRVPAELLKNDLGATLPVVPDALAVVQLNWDLKRTKPRSRFFECLPTARTFDQDLIAAGIAKRDADNRVLDFHALRYTFCRLMAARLPIQQVRRLMTHETLAMTVEIYGELGLDDLGAEVWTLPPIFTPRSEE